MSLEAYFHPVADSFYEEFGKRLKTARRNAPTGRITQDELARRVGLSRSSIANIERGVQQVPLHLLRKFAQALGVEATSLLPPVQENPEVERLGEFLTPRLREGLQRHLQVGEEDDEDTSQS